MLLGTNKCLLEEVFRLNEEECMKVCILLWLVWHQRNKANAGEKIKCPDDILSSINYHTYEYRNRKPRRRPQKQVNIQKWTPPPSEFLKINTDVAFHEVTHSGGWGFTVRDEIWNISLMPYMLKHYHF